MTAQPSDHVDIKIDGREYRLFMSYGLLNRMLAHVGTDGNVAAIAFSNDIRNKLFAEAINKRGKSGCIENFTVEHLEDIDMSSDDAQTLQSWLSEHILQFFISAAEKTKEIESKYAARATSLMPQETGTPA